MRTTGMIGGMSWECSAIYYWMVNEAVKQRLGGHHSAETVMYSVDFAEIKRLQHDSGWEETAVSLAEAARKVEQGGADFVVLCTNTMHRMADAITEAVSIPCCTSPTPRQRRLKPGVSGMWASWPRDTPWSRTSTKGDWLTGTGWRFWCQTRRRGDSSTT